MQSSLHKNDNDIEESSNEHFVSQPLKTDKNSKNMNPQNYDNSDRLHSSKSTQGQVEFGGFVEELLKADKLIREINKDCDDDDDDDDDDEDEGADESDRVTSKPKLKPNIIDVHTDSKDDYDDSEDEGADKSDRMTSKLKPNIIDGYTDSKDDDDDDEEGTNKPDSLISEPKQKVSITDVHAESRDSDNEEASKSDSFLSEPKKGPNIINVYTDTKDGDDDIEDEGEDELDRVTSKLKLKPNIIEVHTDSKKNDNNGDGGEANKSDSLISESKKGPNIINVYTDTKDGDDDIEDEGEDELDRVTSKLKLKPNIIEVHTDSKEDDNNNDDGEANKSDSLISEPKQEPNITYGHADSRDNDEEANKSDSPISEPKQGPNIMNVYVDSKDDDDDYRAKNLEVIRSSRNRDSQYFRNVFNTTKGPQDKIKLNNNPVRGEDMRIQCKVEELAKLFFKDCTIIWYNSNSNSKQSMKRLEKLNTVNDVVVFHIWQQALEYIQRTNTPLQVIVSGQDAEALVKAASNEPKVLSIHLFDRDLDIENQWTEAYPRITSVEYRFNSLLSKLHRDSLKLDFPVFAPVISDVDTIKMNKLHLYLIGLTQFRNRDQAKHDLLALAQRVYRDKNNMDEFAQTYTNYDKTAILSWYTRESFLYKLVNNCIRLATSDAILSSRLAISDLETAIREHYQETQELFSGVLYRGAYLSDQEWVVLEQNIGKDIEMFAFFSTSKASKVAHQFVKQNVAKKILITIIVPSISSKGDKGFAEMDKFSVYAEEEVLFNIRSRFTIVAATVESVDPDLAPCRHLVLLYDARALRIDASLYDREFGCSIHAMSNTELIICQICNLSCCVRDSHHHPKLIFIAMNDNKNPRNMCYDCLRQYKGGSTSYFCFSTRDLDESREVREGRSFEYNQHLGIQFYGSECIGEHHPKDKPIFQRVSCCDCRGQNRVWCLDCFNAENPCMRQKHNVIVEASPYTYWMERASEKDRAQCTFDEEHIMKHWKDQWVLEGSKISKETVEQYYEEIARLTPMSQIPEILDLWTTEGLSTFRLTPGKQTPLAKRSQCNSTIESFYKALEMKRLIYGEIHPEVASLYLMLADRFLYLGEFQRSIELSHRFLDIQKVVSVELNHETIDAYQNLGIAYGELSDSKKAIEYFSEFLVANSALMGRSNPKLSYIYHKLGESYLKMSDILGAIRSFSKCIEILWTSSSTKVASTATNYLILMRNIYNSSENNSNLMRFYHDALKSLLKVFRDPNKTVVECRESLSHNCNQLCKSVISFATTEEDLNPPCIEVLDSKYAELYEEKDLSNKAADFDNDKLSVEERLNLYCSLANNYYRFKKYQKAAHVHFMILKLFRELHFDLEHPSLVMIYITIAQISKRHGVDDKAIELYSQFLEITIAVFGKEHYNTAVAYSKLARAYQSQKDYQKSIELLLLGLETMKMACGEQHCEVAALYCSIADAYDKQAGHEDAVTFYSVGLKMQRQILGDINQDVADVHYRLANSYYTAEDYQKALDCYISVIKIFIELWVHEQLPISLKTAISRVTKICRAQGVVNKVVELYSRFLVRTSKIFKGSHICTKTAFKMLGDACEITKAKMD